MAMLPWWIHYPNVNNEIINLDWILQISNENTDKIENFIGVNTIKYADPILWDITSQYEANTIVVDPQTGDAYISTKAVPYGVALSNDGYWTRIYNYASEIHTFREQIAADEQLSTTATAPRSVDDLVFLNGLLYRVTASMIAGDSYVVGSNCVKTTINAELLRLHTSINSEAQAREDADTALGQRIDDEVQRIDDEVQAREDADTALGQRIDDIKIPHIIDVTNNNIVGDGVTDNTSVLQSLIDSGDCSLYFPSGVYLLGNVTISNNIRIIGDGENTIIKPVAPNVTMFTLNTTKSFEVSDITFNGSDNTFTLFNFENVVAPKIHNINLINVYRAFNVNGSRSMRINNIWQVGDCSNVFTYNNSNYNFDLIVDNWQVDTNDNPTQSDPWFDLTGMVCTQWSNIVTQGRMECIGFDIHGMNEGTFFNNVVLVCPTIGFNIRKRANENIYPGCVQLNNVSVDQYYTSGIIIEGYWIMVNNSAFVNGVQRNATEAAIIIMDEAIRVFFNNVISYNNTYAMFNIGAAKHVKIANCIGYSTSSGAVYVSPNQSFDNPQLVNCYFESVNMNGLSLKNGEINRLVNKQSINSITMSSTYQDIYTYAISENALADTDEILINSAYSVANDCNIKVTINGIDNILSASKEGVLNIKLTRTATGYLIDCNNGESTTLTDCTFTDNLSVTIAVASVNFTSQFVGHGITIKCN